MAISAERPEISAQRGVAGLSWNEVFAIMRQYLDEIARRHSGHGDLAMDRRLEPSPVPWKEPDPSPWRFSLLITGIAFEEILAKLPKTEFSAQLRTAFDSVFLGPDDDTTPTNPVLGPRGPGPVEMAMELGLFAQSLANGALRDRISAVAGQLLQRGLQNRTSKL